MTNTKITSEVQQVSAVLQSGCFEVPWHQRSYDWKVEQVEELLLDLKNALDTGKSCYFLGSIMLVLPKEHAAPTKINDGQQRLITLSLLIAAFCRRFAREHKNQSRETIALRTIFKRSSNKPSYLCETSNYTMRIEPPKDIKSQYKHILNGRDIGTNGLLINAWNAIDAFIDSMRKSKRDEFFDFIMEKLEVSVLSVPSDIDANSVFETLNARGKPLENLDLIRNRIYSYFSDTNNSDRQKEVHEKLESTITILRNRSAVENYFHCYMQCRYGHLRKKRFYWEVQKAIDENSKPSKISDDVFGLIGDLGHGDRIELFRTIMSSSHDKNFGKNLPETQGKRNLSIILSELKEYSVSHSIIFALLYRYIFNTNKNQKRKVGRIVLRSLNNLASFVMRTAFVAPKFEPSHFDADFAKCAKEVFQGGDINSLDIFQMLRQNDEHEVMDDKIFIRHMETVQFRKNDKRALRFLFGINARSKGSDVLLQSKCSVEHVLPQSENHWGCWKGFKTATAADWINRTGNLVVVSQRENRSGAEYNQSYANKRCAFKESPLNMPRTVAEKYTDWTSKVIEERSKQLAQEAAKTWKFGGGKEHRK